MCIMEVNAGQAPDVIAQAMAHNLSTADRDFDMFIEYAKAHGMANELPAIMRAQELTHRAYADMLSLFGEQVAKVVMDNAGHVPHNHSHGGERTFVGEEVKATNEAHPFETR